MRLGGRFSHAHRYSALEWLGWAVIADCLFAEFSDAVHNMFNEFAVSLSEFHKLLGPSEKAYHEFVSLCGCMINAETEIERLGCILDEYADTIEEMLISGAIDFSQYQVLDAPCRGFSDFADRYREWAVANWEAEKLETEIEAGLKEDKP